jgi:cell division protein FtsB
VYSLDRNEPQQKSSFRTRYRLRQYRNKSGRSSRTKLVLILSLGLFAETVLLLILFIKLGVSEKNNLDLAIAENRQAQELAALKPELDKLRQNISQMTLERLPDLQRLEFDKVIPVDNEYVKNIVFTVAGKNGVKAYEYKLVMHNTGLTLVHPQLDILFFDRVGIQVGLAQLGIHKDGTPTLDMLERGEIRSFSSGIQLNDEVAPEYFKIKIRHHGG